MFDRLHISASSCVYMSQSITICPYNATFGFVWPPHLLHLQVNICCLVMLIVCYLASSYIMLMWMCVVLVYIAKIGMSMFDRIDVLGIFLCFMSHAVTMCVYDLTFGSVWHSCLLHLYVDVWCLGHAGCVLSGFIPISCVCGCVLHWFILLKLACWCLIQ
jgi:hypothetical protein